MQSSYIGPEEIAQELGVGRTKAYDIIKDLNKELIEKGFLTIRGKCPGDYFCKRFNIQKKDTPTIESKSV